MNHTKYISQRWFFFSSQFHFSRHRQIFYPQYNFWLLLILFCGKLTYSSEEYHWYTYIKYIHFILYSVCIIYIYIYLFIYIFICTHRIWVTSNISTKSIILRREQVIVHLINNHYLPSENTLVLFQQLFIYIFYF